MEAAVAEAEDSFACLVRLNDSPVVNPSSTVNTGVWQAGLFSFSSPPSSSSSSTAIALCLFLPGPLEDDKVADNDSFSSPIFLTAAAFLAGEAASCRCEEVVENFNLLLFPSVSAITWELVLLSPTVLLLDCFELGLFRVVDCAFQLMKLFREYRDQTLTKCAPVYLEVL